MITKEEYEKARILTREFEQQERQKEVLEAQTLDKGLGKCTQKGCINFAVLDYNGHGCWVCKSCDESLTRRFEDEYD